VSSTLPEQAHIPQAPVSKLSDRASALLLVWGPLMLALYVLSVGPIWKLSDKGFISSYTVNVIYTPLVPLAAHFEPTQQFFTWYIFDLWRCRVVDDSPVSAFSP
jgi:hypothetical protein